MKTVEQRSPVQYSPRRQSLLDDDDKLTLFTVNLHRAGKEKQKYLRDRNSGDWNSYQRIV